MRQWWSQRKDDLPWVGVDLLELELVSSNDLTVGVEDEEAGARGALVNSTNKGDLGASTPVYGSGRHVV